ncbi:hypothetical protein SANTM175S_04613 [Streptomyces antimycoticus]
MTSPSLVRTQPPLVPPRGSLVWWTVTRKAAPLRSGVDGVTTRSSPAVTNRARTPSTRTESTTPWAKSRLTVRRGAVAWASMVVTASSGRSWRR